MDVGPILSSDLQLSVEVFPSILDMMQEEVLGVLAGIRHVLWCSGEGIMVDP